jgi:hypothetical protein
MASEGTAKTLVLVAAILNLVMIIWSAYSVIMSLGLIMTWLTDPLFGFLFFIMFGFIYFFYILWIIFGIIFMLLWFVWRGNPSGHKTGLIVTGVLGLFLTGFGIGGLLALIAGIIAPKK